MFINKIQFSDTDPPSTQEIQILKELKQEGMLEDFSGISADLFHQGNEDAGLLKSVEMIRRAYNDQLLRYNNQYSRLVGNFHTNADSILKIIQGMPEQRFLMEL